MKKYILFITLLVAASAPSILKSQVTWGPGGSIGPNVPTTNLNVGIGFTNPLANLEVKSEVRISAVGQSNYLSLSTPGASHLIRATNNLGIQVDNSGTLNFTLGGLTRTTMTSTGFVGIGITAPSSTAPKLHVHNGSIMVSGPNSAGGAMITFSDNIGATFHPNGRWGIEYKPNYGLNFWQPWNPTPGGGSNFALFLKDDQKIGMGIDPTVANSFPAGYRLYVKDGILTEKVKIAVYLSANWSDYVFADDYRLAPLSEVEAFVKANKHLPNIPSAQTIVDEGGLDVQQIMAKQMEKIEELTLYIIAQEKRIASLEAQAAK